jgi:hypothetical protein
MTRLAVLLVFAGLLTACITTDMTRLSNAPVDLEPVPASEVSVYNDTSSVPCSFQEVGIIDAQSGNVATPNKRLVQRAKEKAGPAGANALVVEGFTPGDNPSGQFLAILENRPCDDG